MPETVRRLPLAEPLPAARAPAVLPALALALLLPALLATAAWLPVWAMGVLDTDDRGFVWIDGAAAAQAAARRAIVADPAFAGGATTMDAAAIPSTCARDATRLHFDVHRSDQAQATRAALENLALAAGAHVCATNIFELNVPVRADREPWRWLRDEAWQALVWVVLPAALVALAFAAPFGADARARLRGDAPMCSQRPLVLAALAVPVVATLAALATSGVVPALQRGAVTGVSPFFALHEVALLPLLHQLAFRTWLFSQLQPRLPLPFVALVSIAASIAATLPSSPADLADAALPALACTALYVRTRSLWPAVALHAAIVAVRDAWLLSG